ncbi:MAG: lamin tail domain-containing protein [Planctomycetota bacterium]
MLKKILGVALIAALGVTTAGCINTGKRQTKSASTTAPSTSSTTGGTTSGTTGGTTSGTTTGTPALDLAGVTPSAPASAKIGPDVAALVVTLSASGTAPVDFADITISSKGSVDESKDLGELKVYGDDNKNGVIDQGEPVLATVAAPAFATNDGKVTISLQSPITIQPGADLKLIVAVDASAGNAAAGVAKIGKTVDLSVEAAGDVSLSYSGSPVTPGGTFPIASGPVTLFLNDHLLISEVVPDGFDGEYIEIFNPTAQAIDLVEYYLTEQSDSSGTTAYYDLPTGGNFDSGNISDFIVRFPPGSKIDPGKALTVAIDGGTFETTYGKPADFCCRNPSGGSVQLLTHNGTAWVPTPVHAFAEIFDTGEPIVLFRWDGKTDLVQDVDYLFVGDPATTNTFNFQWDKSGIAIDGPDQDTQPTQFKPETPVAQQGYAQVQSAPNNAVIRTDFTEGNQVKGNGNGITGNDETSEDAGVTFTSGAPTPGQP